MKGTAISVLIYGETPNDRKQSILHSIKLDREIIALFTKHTQPEFKESITLLRENIKASMQEMIDLERWRRHEGIAKDEAFIPKSLRDKLANMTEDERMEWAERQAKLQEQINDLEYQMWEKQNQKGVENAEG